MFVVTILQFTYYRHELNKARAISTDMVTNVTNFVFDVWNKKLVENWCFVPSLNISTAPQYRKRFVVIQLEGLTLEGSENGMDGWIKVTQNQ